MAGAPGHRFGQIIGEVLENAVEPLLRDFSDRHGLYLDKKGPRPCRLGVKCTWVDRNKNVHELDYVLERGGSPGKIGTPVAFIETAWRRYTKHSRNKAQEIQGAVLPLVETYRKAGPFFGAVLAGEFTDGALTQLRSLGFTVLYFSYRTVVRVFGTFGIDASSEENTPDAEFARKVAAYDRLSVADRQRLSRELLNGDPAGVQEFMASLERTVSRQIERIVVLPLHGAACELASVEAAIEFIQRYKEGGSPSKVERYEIQVRYNNGDSIEGKFAEKGTAIAFLEEYRPTASG
jgi:hypothetical protein